MSNDREFGIDRSVINRGQYDPRSTPQAGGDRSGEETAKKLPEAASSIEGPAAESWDEMWRKWKEGDRLDVSAYLSQRPELNASPDSVLDVIYAEYRLRQEAGESPQVEEYLKRFPDHSEAIRRQFEVHEVLDAAWSLDEIIQEAVARQEATAGACPEMIGKYRVVARLDSGGQAEVFRAVHPTLGKDVAIKLGHASTEASPMNIARLLEEGRILAELEDAHLARIYDLDFWNRRPMLVMEYLRGMNLAQYVHQQKLPPWTSAILVAKLAAAISVVHRRGIVHLDIKPKNILIDERGEPKLLDFGLARWETAWNGTPSASATMGGTLQFMAPEQARGEFDCVGPRSDQFALGGVLYFLLTGQAPFGTGKMNEVWDRAKRCDFDRDALRQVAPKRLQRICLRAMSAKPEDRYPDVQAFAADLNAKSRTPWIVGGIAAIVACAAAIVVGGMLAGNHKPRDGASNDSGIDRTERPKAALPAASLSLRVWRKSAYCDLTDATPVRTNDSLQIVAQMPPGMYGALLLLDSDGQVQQLAAISPSDTSGLLRYPSAPNMNVPLVGTPGTEFAIACAQRSAPIDINEMKQLLRGILHGPNLPAASVLQVTPQGVSVEQTSRGLGDPQIKSDPEGEVHARLETLAKDLSGHLDTFVGVAFSHQP